MYICCSLPALDPPQPPRRHRLRWFLLTALLPWGCGGSAPPPTPPAAPAPPASPAPPAAPNPLPAAPQGPFTLAPATLTLPVPPLANQNNASPYFGRVSLTVTRTAAATGAITLTLDPAQLPRGVRIQPVSCVLAAGAVSAEVQVQAGYPDPKDPSFATQIYPALGSYPIPVTASAAGAPSSSATLTLTLVPEPNDFKLALFSQVDQAPVTRTNLSLAPGGSLSLPFRAYWSQGAYASFGPVQLELLDLPAGLQVTVDGQAVPAPIRLNEPHLLNLRAAPDLPDATFGFTLSAQFQGRRHTLPILVTCGAAPFAIKPLASAQVCVVQGGALEFPVPLWRNDTFFADDGSGPAYQGSTDLSVHGQLPPGLSVAFADRGATTLATAPLVISAAATVAPGAYPVTLVAARVAASTTSAAPVPLTVRVTPAAAAPSLWLQALEWGQTVLAPELRLVAGKPALLRAQLLADRQGVPAPRVLATLRDAQGQWLGELPLDGPGTVPVRCAEGDLPSASAPALSSYAALVPAEAVRPGLQVTVRPAVPGAFAPLTQVAQVGPGAALDLTLVPVIQQGLAPALPEDDRIAAELTAFYPLRAVQLQHRPAYSTATVLPPPGDPFCSAAWAQLLSELASLRLMDGSSAYYFGFLNPGLKGGFGRAIVGISHLGDGVGLGIDETSLALFQNPDQPRNLAILNLVHELGHAFNLNHAPAGGAGNPQLDFPYAGAGIGTWGYEPASASAHDPAQERDIMSYAASRHWISDWNYRSVQTFLELQDAEPSALRQDQQDQWLVSGWIGPDQQPHLAPLLRVTCPPAPPAPGPWTLNLDGPAGRRSVAFAATAIPDLPAGHRQFHFTVPARGELLSAEVCGSGGAVQRRAIPAVAARRLAAAAPEPVLQERAGALHLEWDADAHPFLSVIHEGARRTTLALHLTGGRADLPLAGVPPGGRFCLHLSDGLNSVRTDQLRASAVTTRP